jgi:asparagine synthase (glutamine-hydrolysing)
MCGIVGLISLEASENLEETGRIAVAMASAIHHRGPDAGGIWSSQNGMVTLGHRRLSIIDLSPLGAQPMHSHSGRFTVVFNGEIYNFQELRRDLEKAGVIFRGRSDTEVLLEAIESWGLETALTRVVGMFAFALWDSRECRLVLARDRFGKKPIYYGRVGGYFAFASELKALAEIPGYSAVLDPGAVTDVVMRGFVCGQHSIVRGIARLPPAGIGVLDVGGRSGALEVTRYWSAGDTYERARRNPFAGTEREALDALELEVQRAVQERMVSDVPLGAFLSGGIDSTVVVASMMRAGSGIARTFSIGFADAQFNEAHHARAVAQYLGTNHTELELDASTALATVRELPSIFDEPFADASQIPTLLVSRLARRHVTVALSGDGGDEIFCGYSRYLRMAKFFQLAAAIPRPVRKLAPVLARPFAALSRSFARAGTEQDQIFQRFTKALDLLQSDSAERAYEMTCSYWLNAADVLRDPPPESTSDSWAGDADVSVYRRMMLNDIGCYLPDDILVKVDRATMSTSLEARAPLLDHRLAEFAFGLPMDYLVRGGRGKHLLRELACRYVPRELIERPKMGFGVPLGKWLRADLRDWAEALLESRNFAGIGLLREDVVRARWAEHQRGQRDLSAALWPILMLHAWWERQSRSAA